VHVLREDGLQAALLERNFWYDVMLMGPWNPRLLKPAKPATSAHTTAAAAGKGSGGSWWADPVSRYADRTIVHAKSTYTDPSSKRLFRGAGAVPARLIALELRGERGLGADAARL
jgi:hypothetical protein